MAHLVGTSTPRNPISSVQITVDHGRAIWLVKSFGIGRSVQIKKTMHSNYKWAREWVARLYWHNSLILLLKWRGGRDSNPRAAFSYPLEAALYKPRITLAEQRLLNRASRSWDIRQCHNPGKLNWVTRSSESTLLVGHLIQTKLPNELRDDLSNKGPL